MLFEYCEFYSVLFIVSGQNVVVQPIYVYKICQVLKPPNSILLFQMLQCFSRNPNDLISVQKNQVGSD